MLYDLRLKFAAGQEKTRIKKLEKELTGRIKSAAETVQANFPYYVKSFGLTGPMAQGEGTVFFRGKGIIGSDIDFAAVTKYRSLKEQRKLEKAVSGTFSGSGVKTGMLVFSPSIAKMPDLMFIEYARRGRILFGEKIQHTGGIPVWEAAKLLYSRCGALLNEITRGKMLGSTFPYGWSKAVIGAGDALLITEGLYDFSMKLRKSNVRRSAKARGIPRFLKMYDSAFKARYSGKAALKGEKSFLPDTAAVINEAFNAVESSLEARAGKSIGKIMAPFPSALATRFFYFKSFARPALSEPFAKEYVRMHRLFARMAAGDFGDDAERLRVVKGWEKSGSFRFWSPY